MPQELETLNSKSSSGHGGARSGSGRPKGSLSPQTKERAAAKKAFIERVNKKLDELFHAQLSVALGAQVLIRVDLDDDDKPMKPVIVTDKEEMVAYFNGDFKDEKRVYYNLVTEKPDPKAIDSLLDRALGKPEQVIPIQQGNQVIMMLQAIGVMNQNGNLNGFDQTSGEPTETPDGTPQALPQA